MANIASTCIDVLRHTLYLQTIMPWINNPKKKRQTFNTISSASTPDGRSIYNNVYWKRLRSNYKTKHPLCELCLIEGRSVNADDIHHKKPITTGKTFEERWDLLLDESNLISLCSDCHHKLHNYERKHGLTSYYQLMKLIEMKANSKDWLMNPSEDKDNLIDIVNKC